MNIREALAFYERHGINIIPLRPADKRPLFEWAAYQERMSSPEERALWWPERLPPGRKPNNIGVVTGDVSSLIVLDIDNDDAYHCVLESIPWLGETLTARTGRGWHIYLRPTQSAGKTTTFRLDGALHHVKSNGGYVVAPPSVHPSGAVYAFVNPDLPIDTVDPAVLTRALIAIGAEAAQPEVRRVEHAPDWIVATLRAPAPQGQRNETAAALAGWFRNVIAYREDVTLEILRLWNVARCSPPLPEHELEAVVAHKYRRYPPPPNALHLAG